ncbi:MAG: hypothetical protein ACTSRE_10205 [Promethearchaeota archaeon]
MSLITIITIVFIVLEFGNVLMMYIKPEFKISNGIGVFNAWNKSKEDEEMHHLAKYLLRWVANTKLIFIGLLIVILIWGDSLVQLYSMLVMTVTTLAFFFTQFPIIRKADKKGRISPKNYSIILFCEVFLITGAFTAAFVLGVI